MYFAAMPRPLDRDDQHSIAHRINDPVVSDPNSEGGVAAVEFPAARRPGINGETFGSGQHASLNDGM